MLGSSALADSETITITSPQHGATVLRSETPTINYAGTVTFTEPTPTTRTLFLRRDASDCETPDYLSETSGPDGGNSCETYPPYLLTPLPNEDDYSHRYRSDDAAVQFPITVDASRNLTGEISIRGNTDTQNWQVFEVAVTVGNTTLPRQRFDDGGPPLT